MILRRFNICFLSLEMKEEMRSCLTQAENTLLLLFPAPETFEIHNSIGDVRSKLDSSDQTSDNLLREGIGKTDQTNSSKEVTSSNSINPSNKLPAAKTRHKTECASASEVISNADETSCETVSTHTNDVCLDGANREDDRNSEFQELSNSDEDVSDNDASDAMSFEDADLMETIHTLDERRQHGLVTQSMTLDVTMRDDVIEVVETEDNVDLLKALDDCVHLVQHRFLPKIHAWLQVRIDAIFKTD